MTIGVVNGQPRTASEQFDTLAHVLTWLISQKEFTDSILNGGTIDEKIRVYRSPEGEKFNTAHLEHDYPYLDQVELRLTLDRPSPYAPNVPIR